MKTLELKDICGYLPHGLKIEDKEEFDGVINADYFIYNGVDICDIKPILRPPSDLYKTITHKGKEIIPIVECAKIAFPGCNWKLAYKIDAADTVENNPYQLFMYDFYDGFTFRYNGGISDIRNQYKLFYFLHELNIDYRGLIESGLAIDCNTLEINPYK
jgi:hypothetical protein